MAKSLKPYVSALAGLFYPQRCIGCNQRAGDLLCQACFDTLPPIGRPFCGRCGMPTAFEAFVSDECKGVDFGFESARAPLRYTGLSKEIVHTLKYQGYTRIVQRLAPPLMLGVLDRQDRPDTVVLVPLHCSRLMNQGFDQAELLARTVARDIKTFVSNTIQVMRRTQDQVDLSAAERRTNVSDAFRAKDCVRCRVLLVDDVFITGATLSTCVEALLRPEAAEVHALSLCGTC